jgi:hypothetical protein
MLRLIKLLVVLSLVLAVGLPLVLLVAGLQPQPLVAVGASPTAGDVSRAKALLKRLDPRGQAGGDIRTIEVTERDLAFALDYAVGRLLPAGADIDLHRSSATVSMTAELPANPLGRYYNLRLDLAQVPGGIDVEGLRVGEVAVPEPIAKGLGWLARKALQSDETVRVVLDSVNGYRVTDDRLVVVYQWRPELVDRVKSRGRALLVEETDRERLLAYTARIAATTRKGLLPGRMPLGGLLQPVFQEARDRTGAAGEAAAENRAAIVALMLYVQGVDVARFLDEPADARYRSRARTFTLRGRTDFVQHFLISAGIAAAGGGRLADAVGLFKELDDSRGGSGFSFTDLAANRAGVRFAQAATGPQAARVQALLADGADDSLLMPVVKDLPEFMPEDEFVRRFGGPGDPRYRQVADEIERRIAALALHKGAP